MGLPTGAKPCRHPFSQGSLLLHTLAMAGTHHRHSLIAISPCSTSISLRDFEKRNLKGIKLRLRNKQQLAINKFPQVRECPPHSQRISRSITLPNEPLSHSQAAGVTGGSRKAEMAHIGASARLRSKHIPLLQGRLWACNRR